MKWLARGPEVEVISWNSFNEGIIPSDIGNLTNLQFLYLNNNSLQAVGF
ncbi:hypothetical protein K1719_043839 [Acacia pycnantha]|nr:hypothetical protein K1719_043839 [Acacia pycnantha]